MRARWANICLSKLLCICPSLFEKIISTKQDITSTEISYQFLAPKIALLRRNKAPNSSTSTDPFSAATKTLLVLCISQFHVAVLTEDLTFSLFFRPHPGGFDSSRVPTPGILPSKAKKMLMPGGQLGGGRWGWAQLELTDALGNLFKLERFAITFARAVCILG